MCTQYMCEEVGRYTTIGPAQHNAGKYKVIKAAQPEVYNNGLGNIIYYYARIYADGIVLGTTTIVMTVEVINS